MIVPRLRSEARGGSSSGSSNRYSNSGVYGGKVHHGHHGNDPDLKRALQYSYTSQTVRKWEKRWVVIHETSMKVHKWMPIPVNTAIPAAQMPNEKSNNSVEKTSSANVVTNESTNESTSKMDTNEVEINQEMQKQEAQESSQDEAPPKQDPQPVQGKEENDQDKVEPSTDEDKPRDVPSDTLNEDSSVVSTQDTQMLVDDESTSQSSQP